MQTSVWLGDMVDEVVKVELTTGNTMVIPTGWIHAVVGVSFYMLKAELNRINQATPKDTLVFGGNFLHSYNIGTRAYND
jgi:F-box and leucine-rich repeat protein 10/11